MASELQMAVFELNSEVCGIETSRVNEIIRYQQPSAVPGMPGFMAGTIGLRGGAVPVIDLNGRFGLGSISDAQKPKIIIADVRGRPVGFIVNSVREILKLSDEEMEAVPEIIRKNGGNYIKSVGKRNGCLISVLDTDCLLDEDELGQLEKMDI